LNRSWLRGSLGDRLAVRWLTGHAPPPEPIDLFNELQRARTILILPNDRVGGLFIGAPACKAIRQAYPEARILLVVDEVRASVARQIPFVDEVLTAPLNRAVWSAAFHAFCHKVGQRRPDLALCLGTDCSFRLIRVAQTCGARLRVGFHRQGLAAFDIEIASSGAKRYEGDFYFDMLAFLGLEPGSEVRWAPAPEVARQLRARYLEEGTGASRVVGIDLSSSEGCGLSNRQLDDIVGRVVERGARAVLFFTLAERRQVNYLRETYGKRTILFAQEDLASVAALLQGCRALIACNTDLLHLAMALRVPVVGVFDEDPARWVAPDQPAIGLVRIPDLRALSIGQVVDALDAVMKGERSEGASRARG
jgi:ADP-heptose:LPS heptosyltransferase